MKNKQVAVTITGSGKICAVLEGKSYTIDKTHKNYDKILDAVKVKDWDGFVKLVDLTTPIRNYIAVNEDSNRVAINDGAITFDGYEIHNTLTARILNFMEVGLPFEPLLKFFGNLMLNPSKRAVDELYDFLEAGELPITEDGCFLAFKNVQENYTDIHSGKYDNSVGAKPSMPRNMVDEDANRTCSTGLHFCSLKYLPHFSNANGHTMIVKVNPANVVSVPADFNNTKARACEYEVIAEYTENWRERVQKENDNGFDAPIYSSNGGVYGVKPSGQRFYNVRDEKGHFVKREVEYYDYCGLR